MFTLQLKVSPESISKANKLVEKHLAEPYTDTSFILKIPVRGHAIQQLCNLTEDQVEKIVQNLTATLEQQLNTEEKQTNQGDTA